MNVARRDFLDRLLTGAARVAEAVTGRCDREAVRPAPDSTPDKAGRALARRRGRKSIATTLQAGYDGSQETQEDDV
jgi:hypothetical protein